MRWWGLTPWLFALVGVVASAFSAWRERGSVRERGELARELLVRQAIAQVDDRLDSRELGARILMQAFRAPRGEIGALGDYGRRMLEALPEVTSFVFAPLVRPAGLERARAALAAQGADQARIDALAPADGAEAAPVLDIHPASPVNRRSLGLDLLSLPRPSAAVRQAIAENRPVVTAPLTLVQLPGVPAAVLYAPARDDMGDVVGVIGFSYRFEQLFAPLRESSLGAVVHDRADPAFGPVFSNERPAGGWRTEREVSFGQRAYTIAFHVPDEAGWQALLGAGGVFAVGLLLTATAASFLTGILFLSRRLERSLAAHAESEERLRVVVRELNHRALNTLAMMSALIRQSLRSGSIDEAREKIASRIEAMREATVLIAEAEHGVDLATLLDPAHTPFGARIAAEGPPVPLGLRATQMFALLVHELATNAAKYGALSSDAGTVTVRWRVDGGTLDWSWTEHGEVVPCPAERSGFGTKLTRDIVPRALNGQASAVMAPSGFAYTLTAPVDALKA